MWRSQRNAVQCSIFLMWLWCTDRKRNNMSWARNFSSIFSYSWNFRWWKLIGKIRLGHGDFAESKEKFIRSSLLILIMNFISNILWSVSTESTVRVRSLDIIHTNWLWNFVFRMQIIFHMTKGNFIFWTEEFRFPYANQSVGIYVKATTEFTQFAFSQGSCRSTCELIQIDFFKFHWIRVWATGEYGVTFWKTSCTRNHKMFCKRTKPLGFSVSEELVISFCDHSW